MPIRDQEASKEYQRSWYQQNKAEYADNQRFKRRVMRRIVQELKLNPCTDCGLTYPWYVTDFDHLPGCVKVFNISAIALIPSIAKLLEEIDKCELVCANCHRARTFIRLGGDGNLPARDAGETAFDSRELDVGEGLRMNTGNHKS